MLWSMKIWATGTSILAVSLFSVFMMFSFGGGGTPATYSISGKVTSGIAALPGVTVELTGAASRSTTTDAYGNYRFTGLSKGTYTITPSITGYGFTPANRSVTIRWSSTTGLNFSANAVTHSISGAVTSGGAGLQGVTVLLAGAAFASATTDANGHFQFTGLSSGDYMVTSPSVSGYGFTPANRSVTMSASDVTGVDFEATPNTAWAWGGNVEGQLGDGSTTQSSDPVQVLDLTEVVAVSCGWSHTLALRADGSVWAWGSNNNGQLGVDPTNTPMDYSDIPVQVRDSTGTQYLTGVIAIAAGNLHSLALRDDGTVWAWGFGGFGQLGDAQGTTSAIPVQVSNLINADKIAAGDFYSLALLDDGTVWGWGDGGNGRLGPSNTGSDVPVQVSNLTGMTMTALACGHRYSLAVRSDGTVWAWGENFSGQLGRDTGGVDSSTPGQVTSISDVASIAGGEYHTIAVKSDGTVWTWGSNDNGQLGVGPFPSESSYNALQVTGLSGVVAVAAGSYHSVALGSDGTVRAWGQNTDGQLGDGSITQRSTPVQVPGLTNINKIAAGLSHTAVVKSP